MQQISLTAIILLVTLSIIAQNVEKIRIDPAQSYGGNVSDYFDSVEYIPLETTKNSLFGDVFELAITDSSIVVYDFDTKYILFFGLDGKFITKIKTSPYSIPWIRYNQAINKIEAITLSGNNAQKWDRTYYSFTGSPVVKDAEDKSIKIKNSIIVYSLPNNFFAAAFDCYFPPGGTVRDTTISLINIYKGDVLYKSFFPINQKKNRCFCSVLGGMPNLMFDNQKDLYVSLPGEYAIYKVTADTAIKLYQLVFPENRSFPKDLLMSHDQNRLDSFRNGRGLNSEMIKQIRNISIENNMLMFKIDPFGVPILKNSSEAQYQYTFFYNMRDQRLISIERLVPDVKNYFLPFSGSFHFASYGLQYFGENFYTSISSLQMFDAYDATKSKNPQYPPLLQEYFRTQNRKSNPVIIKMRMIEQ